MTRYDSRQRGRFSQVGTPRGAQQLGYVPVVRSAVVEEDEEWRGLKREGVDPAYRDDPADEALAEDSLPLPEGDLPLPGQTLGDGDLPLPDGGSVSELPLPGDLEGDELVRLGVVPPAPVMMATDASTPRTPAPEPFHPPGTMRFSGLPPEPGHPSAVRASSAWGQAEGGGTARFSALPPAARPSQAPPRSLRPGEPMLAPPDDPFAQEIAAPTPVLFSQLSEPAPGFGPARTPAPAVAPARMPAPEHTPAPGFRSAPEHTPAPGFRSAPEHTPAPGFRSAPEHTPAPGFRSAPEHTPAPGFRSAPEHTPAPGFPAARTPAPVRPSLEAAAARGNTPALGMPVVAKAGRPPPPPVPPRTSMPMLSDDQRHAQARTLLEAGRIDEGFALLEQICALHPEHENTRFLLLELCFRLPRASKVLGHAEWTMVRLLSLGRNADAVEVYRRLRSTFHELVLSERMLVAGVEAADRGGDTQVVLDCAKLLVHLYPDSAYVTRVLSKVADVQLAAGRPDLARATFDYIATNYPLDALALVARQRMADIDAAG